MPRHKMDLQAAVQHLANLKRPEQALRKMGNKRQPGIARSASCPVALYLRKLTGNDTVTVMASSTIQWKPYSSHELPDNIRRLIAKFDSEVF